MKRRSEAGLHSGSDANFNLKLFEYALKDPVKKNQILNLLTSQKRNVFELFSDKALSNVAKSPVKKLIKKRDHCESPTALLRRRELEKINRPESAQSDSSEHSSTSGRSSTVPFENILKNVVAFVEIKSNGTERSGGAKALLRAMGARVCDQFTREVSHVIFKDGSYQTFQRAKLLKVHFVSVLWLEATRRNGVRVPEKNYPALGTKNYDLNVSLICTQMQKDYEDVIREEVRRTLESGTALPTTEYSRQSRRRTVASTSKQFDSTLQDSNNDNCQDKEVEHILSKISGQSQSQDHRNPSSILGDESPITSGYQITSREISRHEVTSGTSRPASLILDHDSDILTSDSECGIVDGDFSRRKVVIDDILEGVAPLQSDCEFSRDMEITCSEDTESRSPIITNIRSISRRKSGNSLVSMELTNLHLAQSTNDENVSSGGILKSMRDSILNSMTYFTPKNKNLNPKDHKEQNFDKENCHTPSNGDIVHDDFYSLKTPILNTGDSDTPKNREPNALSTENFRKMKLNKSNKKIGDPVTSLCRISENLEDVTSAEENINCSTEMSSLRISSDTNKQSTGSTSSSKFSRSMEKSNSTNMSSSKRSKGSIDKSGSTNMSSLKLSKSSIEKSGSTNMSSLNLSKSSIKKSSSTNVSPLRISSEHQDVERKDENRMEIIELPEHHDTTVEEGENSRSSEVQQVVLTPFVTDRKKRKTDVTIKKTQSTDRTQNKNLVNAEESSKTSSKSTRTSRRESLAVKNEKRKFEADLKTRKSFHDKNKEIELYSNKVERTTTSTLECEEEDIGSTSVKKLREGKLQADSENHPQQTDANSMDKKVGHLNKNQVEIKQIKTPKRKTIGISDQENKENEGHKKKKTSAEKNIADKCENANSIKTNLSSTGTGLRPVVILKDILVSPKKDTNPVENNTKKSRRKTLVERDHQENNIEELNEINPKSSKIESELKKKPKEKGNLSISKSKSESNVDATEDLSKRRSKRIRKLYDPEHIGDDILVDDQEERENIRQRRIMKTASQSSHLTGNVLLTQRAIEFFEKNENNHSAMKTLFRHPKSVLEDLFVDDNKKTEKKDRSILYNSSDEQVELAEEFVHKRLRTFSQPTAGTSKTPIAKKFDAALTQKALTCVKNVRRSTLEFEPTSQRVRKIRAKLTLDQKPTIVCTKMHRSDVQMFCQIVRKLGTFEVENEVSSRTTHLVVGEAKRTINMLRAIARGCWVLKQEWLLSSLEKQRWLPEDNYEVTEFSPAVQKCRLERSAFGPKYSMNIFFNSGPIYVAKSTTPRCSDLRELITLCMGKVTKKPENANIVVGAYFDGLKCVNELWILDSVSNGKLKPLKRYLMSKDTTNWVTRSPFV